MTEAHSFSEISEGTSFCHVKISKIFTERTVDKIKMAAIIDSGLRTQDSGLRTQDSGLRTQDSGLRTNYALMKYHYSNLGDEIQSIAASRFLPRIDYYIDREHLNSFHEDKVKMILNGWFMWEYKNFPPSEEIDPLLISFHLSSMIRENLFSKTENKEYLIKHGPVGCRDISTMKFLQENGIPAYFSGCMTMTLKENVKLKSAWSNEYILCVDVPHDVATRVEEETNKPVYNITKGYAGYYDSKDRFNAAKAILFLYHNASAVITTNLHTALPCLAFNTPVCLIEHEPYDVRFSGLDELLIHCKRSEFISGGFYDINNPPANPDTFAQTRDALIEKCLSFTGCCSEVPTLDSNFGANEIIAMLNMTKVNVNEEIISDILVSSSGREMLKLCAKKAVHKVFPSLFKEELKTNKLR